MMCNHCFLAVTRLLAWLLLCSITPGVLLAQTNAADAADAPDIYSCVDAQGRKLTADRPIAACADREQRILNPSGLVKATIGPKLTDQEQSQLDAKRRAAEAERARQEEDRRWDKSLLIRYPNPATHQKSRADALAHVATVKQTGINKLNQLQIERAKLAEEMLFYAKDPAKAPFKLRQSLEEVNQALAIQQRFLNEQDQESERINAHYDVEQRRLAPLWRASAATTP